MILMDVFIEFIYTLFRARYGLITNDYIQKVEEFNKTIQKDLLNWFQNETEQIQPRTLEVVEGFVDRYVETVRNHLEKLKTRSPLAYHEILSRAGADIVEFTGKIREQREELLQTEAQPPGFSELEPDLLFLELDYLKWIEKIATYLTNWIRTEQHTRTPRSRMVYSSKRGKILQGFNVMIFAFLRMIELWDKPEKLEEGEKRLLKSLAYWDLDTLIQWTQTLTREEVDSKTINSDREILHAIWG